MNGKINLDYVQKYELNVALSLMGVQSVEMNNIIVDENVMAKCSLPEYDLCKNNFWNSHHCLVYGQGST